MPSRAPDPEAVLQRSEEGVKATYKQLPETEIAEEAVHTKTKDQKMVQENGDTHHDEAEEKMLTPSDGAEVKFISGDQTNGDAKVDVECIQQVFTGMGKDELMKYAKDPFWVRLRWTLFVLFWLLWTAMLVGAVVIVIAAPKCAAPVPKTWWEEGPLVDVDLPATTEDQTPLFKSLNDVGANVLVVRVPDSYDLYKDNFTFSDIKEFVEKAKAEDFHVILDVQANFVPTDNYMFTASESLVSDYADFFIWSEPKAGAEPTNWKATVNGSAWNLSSKRNEYFLSQFGKGYADLNFKNANVRDLFSECLENLAKIGISGLKLRYAKYLLVDKTDGKFVDEASGTNQGFVHTDYDYYSHFRTSNQPGLGELVKPWKETILNNTVDGVFYIAEDLDRNTFMVDDELIPQLPSMSKKLNLLNRDSSKLDAKEIYTALKSIHSESAGNWPHVQYTSRNHAEQSVHNMLVMLLPCVPELSTEQLLGVNSSLADQTKVLLTARQNPSVKFGTFDIQLLTNETVVGYSRLKPGNPGLIVLYNADNNSTSVDLKPFLGKVETATVLLLSENYHEDAVSIKSTLSASSVLISSKSAMLISYIPASAN